MASNIHGYENNVRARHQHHHQLHDDDEEEVGFINNDDDDDDDDDMVAETKTANIAAATAAEEEENKPFLLHKLKAEDGGEEEEAEEEEKEERLPPLLLSWHDLPPWRQDNEHIHSGFRPLSNSYRACFHSCFSHAHNETGNIFSHLLATVWMVFLAVLFFFSHGYYPYTKQKEHGEGNYPTAGAIAADVEDWVLFGFFFAGGALCFALSTAYHALMNHSRAVHDVWHRVDLLGIVAVTAGCFPPGMWYTFPCVAREVKMWWIGLDLAAQFVGVIFVLFVRRLRKPAWRPLRGVLFSFMASSAFYPIMYACYLHGYDQMDVEAGASRYVLTVVVYLTAVMIYAIRMPEAWRPGGFDIWGHSHQIFHVLMAVGLTVHFSAFVKAWDYTRKLERC